MLGITSKHRDNWIPPPRQAPRPAPVTNTYHLDIWNAAYDPEQPFSKPYTGNPDHLACNLAYAQLKGIESACGARRGFASGKLIGRRTDCVVIPSMDWDGNVIGVECIGSPYSDLDTRKVKTPKQSFGKKNVLILGNDLDSKLPILMCEGWASGVAWVHHINDGNACAAVYFGKSSGPRIAAELEARYPNHVVLLGVEQDG